MIGPVELILVRHGESVRNYSCDLAREGDKTLLERQMIEEKDESGWPLTSYGLEQAAEAGEWIKKNLGFSYGASYVSPFLRARQTTDSLGLELEWEVDDRIQERDWGDYCAPGFEPYSAEQYIADLSVCADLDWRSPYPGGESVRDMTPRVSAFIASALSRMNEGRIIAVTHGGTIRAMQVVLEQIRPHESLCTDRRLSNCCVVMYRLDQIDLEQMSWRGEVRTAHPALPGAPETGWQPITATANQPS